MLASFLMLFVELALIRWTGENVVYLSYFANFVLLGSFLGIGLGFLRARAERPLLRHAPLALWGLVGFVIVFPVEIDRSGSDVIYFGAFEPTGLPVWITLPVIFVLVAVVMALIADGVAQAFRRFTPLEAYRLDIVGSIAGIAGFTLLSFLRAPPLAWAVITAAVFVVLLRPQLSRVAAISLLSLGVALGVQSILHSDRWSPYYRVSVVDYGRGLDVSVNGIPHQRADTLATRRAREPLYFTAYDLLTGPPPQDVLIIGAGTGTDVAIALAEGARRVDAVEIDPTLYEIGRDGHPERPYDDGRVEVFIDDGRAFMENTARRYDLVLFALPDSLTLVSGQSALRLESYLFTGEALATARDLLKPGGAFGMYNYFRDPWLVDRLAGMLRATYGSAPCIESAGSGVRGMVLLMAGRDAGALDCATTTDLVSAATPVTDDYPFLYLAQRGIPALYLVSIGLILAISVVAVRWSVKSLRTMRTYGDLFFMGAAFLLLETKNVVQFALLFGTTWLVNALVFAGVLLSVLAAVEVARRIRLPRPGLLYGTLIAMLAVAWVVPQHSLLALAPAGRFAVATVLAFAPIFLANLVFAQRFKEVSASTVAFGANLLGAMVGGVIEYAALVTGYRALLVVTAALYGLAFVLGRAHLGATGERLAAET